MKRVFNEAMNDSRSVCDDFIVNLRSYYVDIIGNIVKNSPNDITKRLSDFLMKDVNLNDKEAILKGKLGALGIYFTKNPSENFDKVLTILLHMVSDDWNSTENLNMYNQDLTGAELFALLLMIGPYSRADSELQLSPGARDYSFMGPIFLSYCMSKKNRQNFVHFIQRELANDISWQAYFVTIFQGYCSEYISNFVRRDLRSIFYLFSTDYKKELLKYSFGHDYDAENFGDRCFSGISVLLESVIGDDINLALDLICTNEEKISKTSQIMNNFITYTISSGLYKDFCYALHLCKKYEINIDLSSLSISQLALWYSKSYMLETYMLENNSLYYSDETISGSFDSLLEHTFKCAYENPPYNDTITYSSLAHIARTGLLEDLYNRKGEDFLNKMRNEIENIYTIEVTGEFWATYEQTLVTYQNIICSKKTPISLIFDKDLMERFFNCALRHVNSDQAKYMLYKAMLNPDHKVILMKLIADSENADKNADKKTDEHKQGHKTEDTDECPTSDMEILLKLYQDKDKESEWAKPTDLSSFSNRIENLFNENSQAKDDLTRYLSNYFGYEVSVRCNFQICLMHLAILKLHRAEIESHISATFRVFSALNKSISNADTYGKTPKYGVLSNNNNAYYMSLNVNCDNPLILALNSAFQSTQDKIDRALEDSGVSLYINHPRDNLLLYSSISAQTLLEVRSEIIKNHPEAQLDQKSTQISYSYFYRDTRVSWQDYMLIGLLIKNPSKQIEVQPV